MNTARRSLEFSRSGPLVVALLLQWPLTCAAQDPPDSANLCVVMADPVAYQHKLIRVSGLVSRGFEDFMLRGRGCDDYKPFWLEYGGPTPSETVYCCVSPDADRPNGKDPLTVQGIETSLRVNMAFKRFDRMTKRLKRGETVRATLVGRLFVAGTYVSESGEEVEVGFGHFGLFSLFVIEEVVLVHDK